MDCKSLLGNPSKSIYYLGLTVTVSLLPYQTNLPKDGKPLTFCFFADKTKLSSFGTQKGYPVIARCTNLPVNLRNGTGMGGGRIVGWLPIVSPC